MAVRLETTIKRFVGNSTDEKPSLAQSDAGSSFLEEDTGQIARWNGNTWTAPAPQADPLAALVEGQTRTNELLEAILAQL